MKLKRKDNNNSTEARDRRISTIYAKTNSEYFPRKLSKASESDAAALRSGKLLDSVVMYLNYREPDKSAKLSSCKSTTGNCATSTAVDVESVIETIVTPDSFEQDLLSGSVVKERLLNEVDSIIVNKVRWFHCVTRSTFRSLLESLDIPSTTMNILLSSASRSNILHQVDGSIIITLVSLTLDEEKNVNMDQVSLYFRENFIISFECLTSGNVIPENVSQLVKATQYTHLTATIERTVDDSMKFDEFDQTLSREYYLRAFISEFSQTHLFFSEMRSKLKRKYTRIGKKKTATPQPTPTPTFFSRSLSSTGSSSNLISCPLDISYFIYETIQTMLHISIPVLNIYISHQKALATDLTFTSSHSTTHSISNTDELNIIRSGLNLISNLIERTLLCLQTNHTLLSSLLALRPEYTVEILDDYRVIFHLVQKLQSNVNLLQNKIISYEKKKTEQIKIALSMVTVFFFPIGFLASVYGQNFTHSGVIAWMYNSTSGTHIFIALTCLILIITIVAIISKGWGDTLGELHVVGIVLIRQFNWWNQLFSSSKGIYLSKEEINTMISSRKGTISNRLAMHTSARRYQRTTINAGGGGAGGGGGSDRLRNFNL